MKAIILSLFLAVAGFASAFEGIIHCVKTENGVTTSFDFYVKGNQIAVIGSDGIGEYRILLDRGAGQMKLCIDHPQYDKKGYYLYSEGDEIKNRQLTILKKVQTDAIEIDGQLCKGYTVVTNEGTAIAYFGTDQVDLSGFSTYFNDPVYELLDAMNSSTMPRKLVVNKGGNSYTIDMVAEAATVDASYFEVPAGFEKFEVTTTE